MADMGGKKRTHLLPMLKMALKCNSSGYFWGVYGVFVPNRHTHARAVPTERD